MGLLGRIKETGKKLWRGVGVMSALGFTATPGCNKENQGTVSPMVQAVRHKAERTLDHSKTPQTHFAETTRKEMTGILPATNQIQGDPLDGIDFEDQQNIPQKSETSKVRKAPTSIPKASKNLSPRIKESEAMELTEEDIEIMEDLEEVKKLPLVSTIKASTIVPPTISQTLASKQTDDEFSAFIDDLNKSDGFLIPNEKEPLKERNKGYFQKVAVLPKRREENEVVIKLGSKANEMLEMTQKANFSFNPSSLIPESKKPEVELGQDFNDLEDLTDALIEESGGEYEAAERNFEDLINGMTAEIIENGVKAAQERDLEDLTNEVISEEEERIERTGKIANETFAAMKIWYDKQEIEQDVEKVKDMQFERAHQSILATLDKHIEANRKKAEKIRAVSQTGLNIIAEYDEELTFIESNLAGMRSHLIERRKVVESLYQSASVLSGKDSTILEFGTENQPLINQSKHLREITTKLDFNSVATSPERERQLNQVVMDQITRYEYALKNAENERLVLKHLIKETEIEQVRLTTVLRGVKNINVHQPLGDVKINPWKRGSGSVANAQASA